MDIEALRTYCLSKEHVTEDFPFDDNVLVFRLVDKLFALTNINAEEATVNLKCAPDYALTLREDYPEWVRPGYHMNKKHWNTVDYAHLPQELIEDLVTHSYDLIRQSLPKYKQKELGFID